MAGQPSRRTMLAALGSSALALGLDAASAREDEPKAPPSRKNKEPLMITLRRSEQRGHADHGWLNSFHTFSFAGYYDPAHMGFRALRVINEDRVEPAKGFGTHPHRDMEIISYVLEGSLAHKDSMGNGSVIKPGDVQRMSAGSGITHSEFNASRADLVHFLQIWILPEQNGIKPSYEQKHFTDDDKRGKLRLIASRDGRDGSVTIHQDASVYASILRAGDEASLTLEPSRNAWLHVARGEVKLNDQTLHAGDAAAITGEGKIHLSGVNEGEVLLFDLA